ncbi:MAG: hypothetical protein RIB71_02100 [Imperialibacter sp.]|uniref:hypothetical protein n=1 Tax=Imperialibacter sp. TaxID=2038411 RepID=UPI0032EC8E5C
MEIKKTPVNQITGKYWNYEKGVYLRCKDVALGKLTHLLAQQYLHEGYAEIAWKILLQI